MNANIPRKSQITAKMLSGKNRAAININEIHYYTVTSNLKATYFTTLQNSRYDMWPSIHFKIKLCKWSVHI